MAKSYCSTVLDHPADEVWQVIRPFDHYAWSGVQAETVIEGGKAFVEWHATFDCASDEYDHWTNYFEKEGFAKWLAALALYMQAGKRH